MNPLTITCVIPTYCRARLLQQAIGSALAQTGTDVRVAVFDNASDDETPAMAARLAAVDERLRYHRHATNIGALENFIYGVKSVETPLFQILADDDVLLPGFYQRAVEAFREFPHAMFVAAPTLEVDDGGGVIGGSAASTYERRFYAAGEAYGRVPSFWTGWVFRREIVDKIGFIRPEAGPACDVGFLRHVSARFAGVVLPDAAALIRIHSDAWSSTASLMHVKANRAHWDALSRHIEEDEQIATELRSGIRTYIERMYVSGLRRGVLTALIDDRPDLADNTAQALEQVGCTYSAMMSRGLVAAYRHLRIVRYPVQATGRRRRERQRREVEAVRRRFEHRREEFQALLGVNGADGRIAPSSGHV